MAKLTTHAAFDHIIDKQISTTFLTQSTFLSVIRAPGAVQKPVSELFSFRRPTNRIRKIRTSNLLKMSETQLDVM